MGVTSKCVKGGTVPLFYGRIYIFVKLEILDSENIVTGPEDSV